MKANRSASLRLFVSTIAIAFTSTAFAGSPRLTQVYPAGGQRGSEIEVELKGNNLADARELLFDTPGLTVAELKPAAENEKNRLKAKIQVAADARRAVLCAGFVSNVSNELVRYCGNTGIDLVVLTSHTRVGASRLLLGGVADDLLRGSAPVLVLKPGEAKTSSLFAPVAEKVGG